MPGKPFTAHLTGSGPAFLSLLTDPRWSTRKCCSPLLLERRGQNAPIFRANLDLPAGQGPTNRTDIELVFDGLPEPVDLDIDPPARMLYWTDRGDPPRGNTVNRASMDVPADSHTQSEILITHLMEGIGLALDPKGGRMFVTDLAGTVYSANLDGTDAKMLQVVQGNLTSIAYME